MVRRASWTFFSDARLVAGAGSLVRSRRGSHQHPDLQLSVEVAHKWYHPTGGADVLVRADPDAALMGLITKSKTLKMAPSAEESAERHDPKGQMFATVLALSSLPSFPALMAKAGRCE